MRALSIDVLTWHQLWSRNMSNHRTSYNLSTISLDLKLIHVEDIVRREGVLYSVWHALINSFQILIFCYEICNMILRDTVILVTAVMLHKCWILSLSVFTFMWPQLSCWLKDSKKKHHFHSASVFIIRTKTQSLCGKITRKWLWKYFDISYTLRHLPLSSHTC